MNYRVRIPAIFVVEIEFQAEDENDAISVAREILVKDYSKLPWNYESTSPEEYWRILNETQF